MLNVVVDVVTSSRLVLCVMCYMRKHKCVDSVYYSSCIIIEQSLLGPVDSNTVAGCDVYPDLAVHGYV